MTRTRFFTCAVCKQPRPPSMFSLYRKTKCVCSRCAELESDIIPKCYDKIQGTNYILSVLHLFVKEVNCAD